MIELLITFDRMMQQKRYRHAWKAESLGISKMRTTLLYRYSLKSYWLPKLVQDLMPHTVSLLKAGPLLPQK